MKYVTLAAVLLLLPTVAGCDSSEDEEETATITATVVADDQLTLLETAVIRAGLDDVLATNGQFTLFAPTDAAFAAALDDLGVTLAQFLANEALLRSVLETHVLSSERLAGSLTAGQTLTTLNGEILTVVAVGTGFGLDTEDAGAAANATLTATDIDASNGVVHRIDAVLLPTAD